MAALLVLVTVQTANTSMVSWRQKRRFVLAAESSSELRTSSLALSDSFFGRRVKIGHLPEE